MKFIKLAKVLSVSALSAMLLAACGGENDVSTKDKSDDTSQEQSEDKNEEPKEESKVGTRSNPVKMNEIASIDTVTYDDASTEYKTKIDLSLKRLFVEQKLNKN